VIKKNNFIDNPEHVCFNYSAYNFYLRNYWDDWSSKGPRPIKGTRYWVLLNKTSSFTTYDLFPAKEPYSDSEAESASVVVREDNSKIKMTLVSGGQNYPNDGYSFENSVTIRLNGSVLDENNLEGNTGWQIGESLYIGGSNPILDDEESAVGKLGPGSYSITITIIETVIFDDVITIV